MLHTGQLNSNVAGLGRPYPSDVVLICSNAMCISPTGSEHFYSALSEFYAGFYLSVAFIVVQGQYCLPPPSDINLHGMPYSANMIFTVAIRLC